MIVQCRDHRVYSNYTCIYNHVTYARHIQPISSCPRRYGKQVKRSNNSSAIKTDEDETVFDANNELDTRDYTICAFAKWILKSASGQCCDVYGFHDNFKGIEDLPIPRVAT